MKIINCPLNGPRNAQEFACGGEVHAAPQEGADGRAWAEYIFIKHNPAGLVSEWWCHVPSGYWFIAERDTVNDVIERTFTTGEFFGSGPDAERTG